MTPEERARVIAMLPSEIPRSTMPEGDPHRIPKERALEQLRDWFRRRGRLVYLSSELAIYYPRESVFAPDVIAVLDVEPHPREKWVVSAEGRGLDFAMEVHVHGNAKKDREENVVRYARLGIPEYFLFEPLLRRLVGYRLEEGNRYTPIVPQAGRWCSNVLGLDLAMEGDKVRFYSGAAPLPDAEELILRLDSMVNASVERELELASREGELEAQLEQERQAKEQERQAKEQERQAKEQERQAKEQERQAKEDALSRAEKLEARLRALGVDPNDVK